MLDRAAAKAPLNPQVRYTRAEVLESMAAAAASAGDAPQQRARNAAALAELAAVFRQVPREAQVAFRMGVVCKRLGRASDALRFFTLAYDLDPKVSALPRARAPPPPPPLGGKSLRAHAPRRGSPPPTSPHVVLPTTAPRTRSRVLRSCLFPAGQQPSQDCARTPRPARRRGGFVLIWRTAARVLPY